MAVQSDGPEVLSGVFFDLDELEALMSLHLGGVHLIAFSPARGDVEEAVVIYWHSQPTLAQAVITKRLDGHFDLISYDLDLPEAPAKQLLEFDGFTSLLRTLALLFPSRVKQEGY